MATKVKTETRGRKKLPGDQVKKSHPVYLTNIEYQSIVDSYGSLTLAVRKKILKKA